jgi:hypothetical protein
MTNTTTPKKGRPEHEPTPQQRRQVEMMSTFGNTPDQIAQIVGISKPTLLKHYEVELATGPILANREPQPDELPADLLREMSRTIQLTAEATVAYRDWTTSVFLQLADIAKDGIGALDRDEIEICRHVLQFVASAPTRLGIAPISGRTS